jgi:hypothetical protein
VPELRHVGQRHLLQRVRQPAVGVGRRLALVLRHVPQARRAQALRGHVRPHRALADQNTLALSAEGNSRQAFKFLEISAVIYTLAALSTLLSGSLLQELAMPVFFVITWSISLGLFYAMARRKSPQPRSSREFLVVSSYYMGYTLPIYSAIFLLQNASPVLGGLLFLATIVPLWIYMLRVHKAFWQLRGRTILFYLFVSSFTGGIVGTLFLVALMLLTGQDAYGGRGAS